MEELKLIVEQKKKMVDSVKDEIGKVIIGQHDMINKILIGIFTGGHILLEGVPGLAKSLTVNTLSKVLGLDFSRIQFTPDLLPSDIIGTEIYEEKLGNFKIKKGPIFANLILADEINRSPAKVQSALLEAMQEKQVTISDNSFILDKPFIVLATQNPLEQDGTYPLPEAQQDRFLMKVLLDYPTKDEERKILDVVCGKIEIDDIELESKIGSKEIFEIRELIKEIHLDDKLKEYILDIVLKTREDNRFIECGASPRATISLYQASKAKAFLEGREFVMPDDIKSVVYDVLRHRIALTFEAEAENKTIEDVIEMLLEEVVLP